MGLHWGERGRPQQTQPDSRRPRPGTYLPGCHGEGVQGWVLLGHVPSLGPGYVPLLGRLVELDLGWHEAMPAEGLESLVGRGGGGLSRREGPCCHPYPTLSRHPRLVEPKGVLSPPALMLYPICCPLVHPLKQSRPLHIQGRGAHSLKTPAYLGPESMSLSWCYHCPMALSPAQTYFCSPGACLKHPEGLRWRVVVPQEPWLGPCEKGVSVESGRGREGPLQLAGSGADVWPASAGGPGPGRSPAGPAGPHELTGACGHLAGPGPPARPPS